MIAQRVEKHIINKKHPLYLLIDDYCFKSKNLYNYINYILRQEFINNGKIIKEYELSTIYKNEECYKELMAQTSQQVIKQLCVNWKSFFISIKDWSKHKEKYSGRPKLPKYKNKTNGRNVAIFTNQNCKLTEDGSIKFPRIFNRYLLKTKRVCKLQTLFLCCKIIPIYA